MAMLALSVDGCSSPNAGPAVEHEQFSFSCCAGLDAAPVAHAGETLTFRWNVETIGVSPDSLGSAVTLTAVLTGPYGSVALVKTGGDHSETISAAAIHATTEAPGDPVSTIDIPSDLPPGWYNVTFATRYQSGSRVSSGTVIEVTRAVP
ncbi:MAG TPA: hypothetical protein VI434_14630 [Candidatus Dormibacteraeota bacterium]